jgi:hypothetical protein
MTMDEVRMQGDYDGSPEANAVMFTRHWAADDVCTLEIRGDLDIAISGLLRQELDELLGLGIARLDVDLAGVGPGHCRDGRVRCQADNPVACVQRSQPDELLRRAPPA